MSFKTIFYLYILGPSSYKEHCHRMLRIWVDSLPVSVDAVQELNNSLIAIDKKKVAGRLFEDKVMYIYRGRENINFFVP